MATFVEIAVNVPQVTGVFHYHLPPELEGQVAIGHLVAVPFGRQTVQGVVLGFVEQPAVAETRPVMELIDAQAVLTQKQLALARSLAEDTLAPLAACIDLMLPAGLAQRTEAIYAIQGDAPGDLSGVAQRLWRLLKRRGALRAGQIERSMPRLDWQGSAERLVRGGYLSKQSILPPPRVRPKYVRTAQLACAPEEALSRLNAIKRQGAAPLGRRAAILRFLAGEAGAVEVTWVYAESGGNSQDLQFLSEHDLIILGESEVWRDPLRELDFQPSRAPALTRDQSEAWAAVQAQLQAAQAGKPSQPLLLHGVTGSGKTEIYLRAVAEVLHSGRQAIVLVPEIALTPQTLRRFAGRFPGQVGLVHSGLSEGERYDTWRRARAGLLKVVVGPRSALFTPFPDPGLIVVDECHDDSYYQDDVLPYYDARQAAITYARLTGAACLFGSATPDVIQIERCRRGEWGYLRLPARILAHRQVIQAHLERLGAPASSYRPFEGEAETTDLPAVQVVDMRQELKAGNRAIFSEALQEALGEVLEHGQQAMLFLNRRGAATYVFCRDCGYTVKCPRCEIPLTYHSDRQIMLCHHCGYERKFPAKCPNCGSQRIRAYGTGTQRVEAEVQAQFPQARTLRWDYETTRKKGAHEIILSHFIAHRADVLIGTQMLAKGLDLPLVTLVGVVLADVGLSLPDYRAAERTFQVLTQVAGRAGRSPLGGRVILQTFQPEHYTIQAAAKHDYKAFFQQELAYRKKLSYPPFNRLVRLEYRHADPEQAEQAAQEMAGQVRTWLEQGERRATRLIGPAPCFFQRIGGLYRWQLILCGPEPVSLLRGKPLGEWRAEVDPQSLL